MSTQPLHKLTPEEYLELERKAEFKSEYYQGEMFAMSGASAKHCTIVVNLLSSLKSRLRGSKCKAFNSDLQVKVTAPGLYTYADVVVACGSPQFADSKPDTLTNPTVIVEVLSESTRDYDLGRKFEHYRTIETLRDYITVDQDTVKVTHWTREPDGAWTLRDFSSLDSSITLASLDTTLPLAEVYEDIDFTAVP